MISALADWKFAGIRSIGWGWTGVIWVYNSLTYLLLDPIKFAVRYALSGKAWNLVVDRRVSDASLFLLTTHFFRILTSTNFTIILQSARLHLRVKRTSARKLVKPHGQESIEHYMDCSQLKQKGLLRQALLRKSVSWQKKPEGAQRLPGQSYYNLYFINS